MENFAAAILSNSAPDIPADRRQWLHIINRFFLPLTPSAPYTGVSAGHTHLLEQGLWTGGMTEANPSKTFIPATDLIGSRPAARGSAVPPHLTLHGTFFKQTSWHTDFQLLRSQRPVAQTKPRLLNANAEGFLLWVSFIFLLFVRKIFTNSWKTTLFRTQKS